MKDNDRGHWEPPICSQTFSEIGDLCSLVCNEGYETFGPDDVICTSEGWNGTGGLNALPACKSMSPHIFISNCIIIINYSQEKYEI